MRKFLLIGGIGIGLLAVVMGIRSFVTHNSIKPPSFVTHNSIKSPTQTALSTIASCVPYPTQVLTTSPIDLADLLAIQPLGWVNGQDHILPVDHSGLVTTRGDRTTNRRVPIYAPADITINQLTSHVDYRSNGQPYTPFTNYMMTITVCPQVHLWLEWLNELSPDLAKSFANGTHARDEGPLNDGAKAVNDTVKVNLVLKAGDLIGYAGGPSAPNAAISAFDSRTDPRSDVDWRYYTGGPFPVKNVTCFSDLYGEPLRTRLTAKYGQYMTQGTTPVFVPTTNHPACGSVVQNKVGTLAGDWFASLPKTEHDDLQSQGKTVSFITHFTDASFGMVSIGGNIVSHPATLTFLVQHDGTTNRLFNETGVGQVYCYQAEPNQAPRVGVPDTVGQLIAELVDDHHARLEFQVGNCRGTIAFTSKAAVYER